MIFKGPPSSLNYRKSCWWKRPITDIFGRRGRSRSLTRKPWPRSQKPFSASTKRQKDALAHVFDYYCWKLLADVVGQRRVWVVVPGVIPPARKVQHSPSVEE